MATRNVKDLPPDRRARVCSVAPRLVGGPGHFGVETPVAGPNLPGVGRRSVTTIALVAWVAASAVSAPHLSAQSPSWDIEGELGAAFFFGNTSQTTISAGLEGAQADSAKEIAWVAAFTYGEAGNEDGNAVVNKRSWAVGAEYDHRPFADWNPFVSGEVQSSFERRIDLRYTIGAGAKYTIQRSDRGRLGMRLSLLAEQTNPAEERGEELAGELLARWALGVTFVRRWDDGRLEFETANDYKPELDRVRDFNIFSEFVFTSKTSLAFRLNSTVSLKLTLLDTYDSKAKLRGAETNNDGQFLISVLTKF